MADDDKKPDLKADSKSKGADEGFKEAQAKLEAGGAAKKAAEAEANVGLVKMLKGDQELYVHPTAVKDHESAGWEQA